jgi:hypothetical protein
MLRRTFLQGAGAVLASSLSPSVLSATSSNKSIIDWSNGIKPVYCLAYIDPANKLHRGQELEISKYPIAVIPQDNRVQFGQFRTKLKRLNKNQKILAYQLTLDENEIPGPGHDLIRKLKNSWLTLPGGIKASINVKSAGVYKDFRIYDPRDLVFRQKFIEACKLLVNKNGFDGIFLDNCTIYGMYSNIPILGNELMNALQSLIDEVRIALPNTILIGNSRYNWNGLNGEMNEGRPSELPKEVAGFSGHASPQINMYHYYMKNSNDLINAEQNFRWALENQCFFGTGINNQTIKYYNFFDKILSEYQIL